MQTSIQTVGFRALRPGEDVEFDVQEGEDGKRKAVNVTGPKGAPPQVGYVLPIEWGPSASGP